MTATTSTPATSTTTSLLATQRSLWLKALANLRRVGEALHQLGQQSSQPAADVSRLAGWCEAKATECSNTPPSPAPIPAVAQLAAPTAVPAPKPASTAAAPATPAGDDGLDTLSKAQLHSLCSIHGVSPLPGASATIMRRQLRGQCGPNVSQAKAGTVRVVPTVTVAAPVITTAATPVAATIPTAKVAPTHTSVAIPAIVAALALPNGNHAKLREASVTAGLYHKALDVPGTEEVVRARLQDWLNRNSAVSNPAAPVTVATPATVAKDVAPSAKPARKLPGGMLEYITAKGECKAAGLPSHGTLVQLKDRLATLTPATPAVAKTAAPTAVPAPGLDVLAGFMARKLTDMGRACTGADVLAALELAGLVASK